jgi:hypothetical protein
MPRLWICKSSVQRSLAAFFVLCSLLCFAASSVARTADASMASKIAGCYAKGSTTINKLHDCIGAWVTPRIFMLCALQGRCVPLPDTDQGRATLTADLHGFDKDATLVPSNQVFQLPSPLVLVGCRTAGKSGRSLDECVALASMTESEKNILSCARQKEAKDEVRVDCFLKDIPDTQLKSQIGQAMKQVETARNCLNQPGKDAELRCLKVSEHDAQMADCLMRNNSNSAVALKCLDQLSPEFAETRRIADCVHGAQGDAIHCVVQMKVEKAAKLVDCVSSAKNSYSRLRCGKDVVPEFQQLEGITTCKIKSRSPQSLEDCLQPIVGDRAEKLSKCFGGKQLETCIAQEPRYAAALMAYNCAFSAGSNTVAFNCIAPQVSPEAKHIADCLSAKESNLIAACLLGKRKEYKAVQQVVECANAGDTSSLILNCTKGVFDDRTRLSFSCISKAGHNREQLAGCAAAALLPPQAVRIANCLTTSQGVTSAAICAAGPSMNEEWRTVAECASASGGIPIGTGICAAGRLTLRELTKCLTSKGKDCYGPNNTAVKAVRNAYHDLTKGPGRGSEVVKGLHAVETTTHNVSREVHNFFHHL